MVHVSMVHYKPIKGQFGNGGPIVSSMIKIAKIWRGKKKKVCVIGIALFFSLWRIFPIYRKWFTNLGSMIPLCVRLYDINRG